ncbi:MAG: hypothetical protein Q4C57_01485 [Bacillota bacterium]|nr:hypothetical protein [Bacillota bacterium]
MAWCPKCKCEYVEGITVCADCECELVEKLPEEGTEPEITQQEALAMMQVMMESGKGIPEELFNSVEAIPKKASTPYHQSRYVNNEEKAEENRASAIALLAVGGIGLVATVLFYFDYFDINSSLIGKYVISGVMGVVFILFIIMGIVSLRNSRILRKEAHKENNLTAEIKKWCIENLYEDEIDRLLDVEQQSVELKYFQRFDYVKSTIQNQFMNLDEDYLDRLIEEIYSEIFKEDDE